VKLLNCFDRRERRWRKERIEHGISEGDAWDLFAYLDEVIARGARQLAENLHGCPAGMPDQFGGDIDKACAHWQAILEEVAIGFERELEAQADFKPSPPEFYRAMDLLHEHWRDLWD
jgi:hypothetical protein